MTFHLSIHESRSFQLRAILGEPLTGFLEISMARLIDLCFILFSAKYGTPNRKMELLFQLVPQLRRLGYLHYAIMTKPTLGIITPKSKEV